MFSIETKCLILRDMELKDEAAFVAISQNKKYQRFYSEEDCDPKRYRDLTRLFIAQANENPRLEYQLAIELKGSNEFIGTVCLRMEDDSQASMGCGLSRKFQGGNLIFEAVSALLCFGFNELGVHRIYAETISENSPVIKLCEKIGMRREAWLKEHRYFKGRWWDTVILAMLHNEFEPCA